MKIKQKRKLIFGDLITAAPKDWSTGRSKLAINARPMAFREQRIQIGFAIAVLAALTSGCVGFVGGGYSGGVVVAPAPDVVLFGGGYDRGRDEHSYSQRGSESREAAHPSGGGRGRR